MVIAVALFGPAILALLASGRMNAPTEGTGAQVLLCASTWDYAARDRTPRSGWSGQAWCNQGVGGSGARSPRRRLGELAVAAGAPREARGALAALPGGRRPHAERVLPPQRPDPPRADPPAG